MIKHIILWQLKDEYTKEEKEEIKKGIKEGLESLSGKIPGLVEIKVYNNGLPSSKNAELMLDSTFLNEESLSAYSTNPLHVAVADGKVRPFVKYRSCLNFEV